MRLSNPSPGTTLGAITNASLSIEPSTVLQGGAMGFERMWYHVREGMANPVVTTYGTGPVSWSIHRYAGSNTTFTTFEAGSDLAALGADFTLPTVTGIGSGTVPLPLIDDNVAEFNEEFILRMLTPAGSLIDECFIVILNDDDPAGAFDRDYNPDFDDRTIPPQNSAPGANNTVFAEIGRAHV